MDYKGIKIKKKIIIVEKTFESRFNEEKNINKINQGYVVDCDNKKALENALAWASWTKYPDPVLYFGEGKYEWSNGVTKEQKDAFNAAKVEMPGIIHEYDNGQFEITLSESANSSNQGGKLSFWNCLIKAPDGNTFLIGINSELLLHLMMSNTLVNGTCTEKVWLGRVSGQVGVFTSNMEDFKQAIKDEKTRQAVSQSNSKYNVGDILKNIKSKELYLGTVYKYYDFDDDTYYGRGKKQIIIYDKPKLMHVYRRYYNGIITNYYDLTNTKLKRLVVGHLDNQKNALDFINDLNKENLEKSLKGPSYPSSWQCARELLMYANTDNAYSKNEIRQYLINAFEKYNKYHINFDSEYVFSVPE